MKNPLLIPMVLLLAVTSFLVGYIMSQPSRKGAAGDERKVLYYIDPMNPRLKSEKPGIAPCGMPLEPVYADTVNTRGSAPPSLPPGTVRISPEKQHLIGLKIATVEKKPGAQTIRLLGRVAPDETRTYRINAATDVWVRKVFPSTTGSLVGKDEPLMAYYTSAFLAAANAYLFALDTQERHKMSADVSQAQAQNLDFQMRQAVGNLLNMGVSESQMTEMAKTRKTSDLVEVRSPSEGYILARSVTPGQFVPVGTELYRIADLSRVWILAETYEKEGPFLNHGMEVMVKQPHTNRTFKAKVSDILPLFDPQTRTMKIRLEADNPGYALRPDMFVDVEILVNLPVAIVVPADAVIDTGTRKTVYVDRGDGDFEPRMVETGWRLGRQIEITGGLAPGEKIIVSANFLVDSESRMRGAAQGAVVCPTTDPVCGMFVDEEKAAVADRRSKYQGKTYFFCSKPCKVDFEKDPRRYAERGVKEPDAKTKDAMMKELGMQDKTSSGKPGGADNLGTAIPADMKTHEVPGQVATDMPETLLPPPQGMEVIKGDTQPDGGRGFSLPSSGKE